MTSRKKGGCLKKLLILIIVLAVIGIAAYWFIPQLLVKLMHSDSVVGVLPPQVNQVMRQTEKRIPRILKQVNLTPEQAKEEVDNVDYDDLERVMQQLSKQKSMTKDQMATLIQNEMELTHLNAGKIKNLLPNKLSSRQIAKATKLFEENKGKIRILLPTLKESVKQMIEESTAN